ncbi:hypothetical protein L3X38_014326 [Prunus dulcis]|uniref:Uncharacterized protein n=1 Tax=Prunus dulcis TaxID=3755 RepID=A0AAD4ZH03_PRUDU|nr:hypothetical protein L3X38_014326 [Prunus dulcis]
MYKSLVTENSSFEGPKFGRIFKFKSNPLELKSRSKPIYPSARVRKIAEKPYPYSIDLVENEGEFRAGSLGSFGGTSAGKHDFSASSGRPGVEVRSGCDGDTKVDP